jgi:hypothetical protein
MRSTISQQVGQEEFNDLLNNHKKFIAVPVDDLVVAPQVGDMVAVQLKGSGGARGIYRVVTHCQDAAYVEGGEHCLLSLRPLGKAEKEELRK